MAFYLAIVSPLDAPLFELQFTTSRAAGTAVSAGFPTWSSFTESASAAVAAAGTSATPSGSTPATPAPATGEVGVAQGAPGDRNILQMIAHAGLDAVEEVAEGSGTLYLKAVDKHNEWTVSAFLATNVKFILLHDTKNDDGIRLFFGDVWELYTKIMLNPFHTVNTPIRNPAFEAKVRASAKKNL